ncbi:hypothetical protein [Sporomusa termitida]|uniref:Uncharacterized protein n=1 Tax=Sporomusa termitida TaxID=2377 RepID=A0A517DQZ1_9FIRM|nr:hypothetical protein [Sporomusa termitida]QDR79737.1 hypothetical protein SPTER_10320 [Sporomusa termitida]
MAATVIPFPTKKGQDLSQVESLIRKWLSKLSHSNDMTEYIVERMLIYVEQYGSRLFEPAFNLPVPPHFSQAEAEALLGSLEKGVDDIAVQVQEMVSRIIIERFFLEIELYENRQGGKNHIK